MIHEFENDFYDEELKLVLCGYLRPELNYSSIGKLIDAIKLDIHLSKNYLNQFPYNVSNIFLFLLYFINIILILF